MLQGIKQLKKNILRWSGINPTQLRKRYLRFRGRTIAYNVNKTQYERRCLIQYLVSPFLGNDEARKNSHQNQWQVVVLAEELGKFGYNVDVRDVDESSGLKTNYDLVLDIHPGLNDTYKAHMNEGCCRIAYLTGMNPRVANKNEQIRMSALRNRRGVLLPPERACELVSQEIETFDAFLFIGNAYNLKSFDEFCLPPVYFIKNTGYTFPFPIKFRNKDTRKFLFFASSGQVHKGLDLLLEIFGQKDFPFELYICSSFQSEKEFCEVYKSELFHTSNIHSVGFIDIMGEQFCEISEKCSFTILPSCSEGVAGSVLTAMSAGIIPIVSRECGFEDDEVIQLRDCDMETIEEAIRYYGEKDSEWIEQESIRVRQIVKDRYSRESFVQSVRAALQDVLGKKQNQNIIHGRE